MERIQDTERQENMSVYNYSINKYMISRCKEKSQKDKSKIKRQTTVNITYN